MEQTTTGVRVAFQGERGAFGEEAIHLLWRGEADPVPSTSFEDVMSAAETGSVDYGLLPIESTLVGGLDIAYDLLSLHDELSIVSEVIIPVNLCLLGLPGATIRGLRTLASQQVMLSQCTHFLTRYKHISAHPSWDTAGAAREVSELGDPSRAAAGTRRAAERFGLSVMLEHLEDRPDCQMRFLAVGRTPATLDDVDRPARRSSSWFRQQWAHWSGRFSRSPMRAATSATSLPARRESRGATSSSSRSITPRAIRRPPPRWPRRGG